MTAPAPTPVSTPLGLAGERCSACSAPLAEDQRYCLNCGLRRGGPRVAYDVLLRGDSAESAPAGAPLPVAPSSPARTISPLGAAAGLGLLLLAIIAGALLGGRREEPVAQQVVTVPASATTPTTATPTAFVSDWSGEDGWTVQLQALPKAGATPEQVAAAKASALSSGAADVGALDSTEFASLTPDQYVIYSGRYDDEKAAKAALKELKASFPDAQVIEVSTSAPDAAATDETNEPESKTSDTELKELENASPDEYIKKSRKLPDEVVTEGEPPPVDNAAPGGGTEAAEIG